jgi:arylsulfatase A-like enzyme
MLSRFLPTIVACLATFVAAPSMAAEPPPNIVLIVADDMGYADPTCFGLEGELRTYQTTHLDKLASEGTRFTNFYVSQAVCTASRASFLTGCYANRVGLQGALNHTSKNGLNPSETTLAELCKARGYATACYGKWHLGMGSLGAVHHGFDEFFGLPYSNDNGPFHPTIKNMPPLPLIEGEKVIATDPDQSQFTRQFTDRAIGFIKKNKEKPFFLYLPHVMPHVPIFASDKFNEKSGGGLYTDVLVELDAGIGEVLATLKEQGLEENTLVIFFSDNGPFLSYGSHAGSARPLREGKLTAFEGGVRVPCIMRWPGKIRAKRVCDEMLSSMDLLPTIATLLDQPLPQAKIDGKNILPVLTSEPGAKSPREALFIYSGTELHAVISGQWKLHFPHPYLTVAAEPGRDGKPSNWANLKPDSISKSGVEGIASRHGYRVEQLPLSLYNLSDDPGEQRNVAEQHPDIVSRLSALAETMRADLGDSLLGRTGPGVRPAGKVH